MLDAPVARALITDYPDHPDGPGLLLASNGGVVAGIFLAAEPAGGERQMDVVESHLVLLGPRRARRDAEDCNS